MVMAPNDAAAAARQVSLPPLLSSPLFSIRMTLPMVTPARERTAATAEAKRRIQDPTHRASKYA